MAKHRMSSEQEQNAKILEAGIHAFLQHVGRQGRRDEVLSRMDSATRRVVLDAERQVNERVSRRGRGR